MAFNNFPPQAYTRDTLAQAYEWLSHQPTGVREMANNADTLVALYLQTLRRGGVAPSKDQLQGSARPVGSANHSQVEAAIKSHNTYESEGFKSDLKALAENMKQFESPTKAYTPAISPEQMKVQIDDRVADEVRRKLAIETAKQSAPAPKTNPIAETHSLDARTRETLTAVCERLNLGSEQEALRMLVVLGAERLKQLIN